MFLFDEADFEEIECLMPNGVLLAGVKVHPGDSIFHIKEAVLEKATTGKKLFNGKAVSAHAFAGKMPLLCQNLIILTDPDSQTITFRAKSPTGVS